MKGWKKKNSNSESVHAHSSAAPPPCTNGGGKTAEEEEWRENLGESSKLQVAEQAFEEEEGEDQDSESEKEYEQIEEPDGERKKLADGYYEIEAVRRKRIRKGQVQYLIKWRGWSEAANTWEPVKNLVQCSDVIDAFEESLKSGKSRLTRKRKRKSSIPQLLPKKKQQQQQQHQSPARVTYNVPSNVVRTAEPLPRLNDLTCKNVNGETNINGVNSVEICKKVCENGVSLTREEEMQNELNLKLCELKGATAISMEDADSVAIYSQEDRLTGVVSLGNGFHRTNGVDPVKSGPCTGAKKRKSGSVKRFKKDPGSCPMDDSQVAVASCAMGFQNPEGDYANCTNKYEDSRRMCAITQIVKPISYKASTLNNVQEVFVAFEAVRSDGTKVTVDNKFLKANNPLLLIDFYEKHLRCSPAS
ncbi:hypothetical protein RD792_015578 [Penstemon davidsonii]|uniref:Chromo domain-containing protein n=1 Tax=Penstemon davidsonii TaxID=160366 RepID=A0ABR0CI93_9LAMI|nr:hypothetical protein RD792_015578 [Penstemon davidsonii]